MPSTLEQQKPQPIAGVKKQPWMTIWPAERESQPQAQIFGFEKGERMIFDGNAGNFFSRDGWVVEQEAFAASKKIE